MTDISALLVLKQLSVHKLTVEKKRVKATYTVQKMDGTEVSNELIYSYEQAFFDPAAAADINLASMMVAQVALNYGLFFETIVFDGLYEEADKRFLLDMLENTSREIYVNKFLHPNEFLRPPFDQLEARQMKEYTGAKVIFQNTQYSGMKVKAEPVVTAPDQYAILSSGGKDSLLTYGLVKEFGEAHPVFINESGRHWFTAVNAHKYYREHEPNTVKPWCNSDRIFNWMVRQMPFIREDYASVRADIYPIRLWTVAVFLFGVLPVVRKRGIGNVLIGNEYDTTVKSNFQGITHYNALYDQSKYFDNALTRYYSKKGWNIRQYSALRSLSELLILKVLVKRYPELQREQVSCHAAHERDGRMYPCGNCEKCRRIIGMLKALDEDPRRCGYTDEQIQRALKALEAKSVKQIGSDAAHLYYLLLNKGLIASNERTRKLAKAHPEILQLRFDQERSKIADLPAGVRAPLFRILEEYAQDAVRLEHGKPQPLTIDPEFLQQAYFLEKQS
ncbi:hypothetical protein [Flavilitoribacter nigricans]|uniref:Uncharacterized protein n=1 Tax=Flavilitoribacter nigricans (strain ATCC 23147 / DSM 23189 / NBRC 102662 / NCIMB 1420 / SS-2) TaxID=1122177 RepID=A0A2D0NHE6_FLAN2|nr:hypothetical protein [Flavilitoribacter nigricans]PHN07911.1 hypothetical protein CRP01_03925 [Flavilitoribacter nigricans DSM 23189 = NBRC 102662]